MKLKYQMRGLGIGIMVTALLMGVVMEKGLPLSDAEIKAKALELGMVERESLKLTDIHDDSPSQKGTPSSGEGDMTSDGIGTEDSAGADINAEVSGSDASSGANGSGEADASSGANGPGESDVSSDDSDEDSSGGSDSIQGAQEPTQAASVSNTETLRESGTVPEQNGSGNAGSGLQDGEETHPDGNGGSPAKEAVTVVIEFGVTSAHVSELLEEAGLVEDASAFDAYLCNNGYSRRITAGVYEIQPGTSEEEIIDIITKNR